ncbi:MAG: hypothetical protein MZW92_20795 [Comamonadaceae bacterium]|nr:hypothetical protein [Comamonadaceae bacterium]
MHEGPAATRRPGAFFLLPARAAGPRKAPPRRRGRAPLAARAGCAPPCRPPSPPRCSRCCWPASPCWRSRRSPSAAPSCCGSTARSARPAPTA